MATRKGSDGSKIKINTTAVRNIVTDLESLNDKMESDFDIIASEVSNLHRGCNSSAMTKASSKFNSFKAKCKGSSGRRAVMKQYTLFLRESVAAGYESTENKNTDKANTNLAELFKK